MVYLDMPGQSRLTDVAFTQEQGVVADMTEPTSMHERLRRLNLVLRTIRDVNQLIMRNQDRARLIDGIASTLVRTRGYQNAWLALFDDSGSFLTAAEAGLGDDFLPMMALFKAGGMTSCARAALASRDVVGTSDPASTCTDCPLASRYVGWSALTAQLNHDDRLYGLLCASVPADMVEDEEEVSLFGEVAGDIAFALHSIEVADQRRRAERALRLARFSVEQAGDMFYMTGAEGAILDVNDSTCHALGYSRKELLSMTVWDLDPASSKSEWCQNWENLRQQGRLAVEANHRTRSGNIIPVEIMLNYLQFEGQEYNCAFARDITDRRRAEEALLTSESQYRALFESANDGILVRDLEGNILMANAAMADLAGFTIDELKRMNISQFLTPASFEVCMVTQRRRLENEAEARTQRHELDMVRSDGTPRTVEVVTSLLADSIESPIMQTLVRDVTEQKRARESARAYANEVIWGQEEERRRIALELHDDTAQDLVSLGMEIGLLAETVGELSPEIVRRLVGFRDRTDHVLQGVRALSQALRPPMLEELGLIAALQGLTTELKSQHGVNSALNVRGQPRRLSTEQELTVFRIAQEALNNVWKHARATESTVNIDFLPDKVRVVIADNGCGFDARAEVDDPARVGRLGILGMHERARLIGGTLAVRSEPGRGTTLELEVPR